MVVKQRQVGKQHDLHEARCHPFLLWLTPIMLFAPYTLTIYLDTLKLTPGKLLTTLCVIPAIFTLLRGVFSGKRRLVAADFLALAFTIWMIVVPTAVSEADVIVNAASQSIEFFGAYMIGRAYFFGSKALSTFGRALGLTVIVLTALGLLDTLTHRYLVSETFAAVSYSPGQALDANYSQLNRSLFGIELLRAASTFDHPILFGMFCAISASILIYMPPSTVRSVGIVSCVFGSVIALSSAPMLALTAASAVHFFDVVSRRAMWRWKALSVIIVIFLAVISIVSNNPFTWIIRNLTFDPQTGYFRLLQWDAVASIIDENPWTGIGFRLTGNKFIDGSLDSLWLGKALAYGMPGVILLLLVGITVIVPARGAARLRARRADVDGLCTGFSLAIVLFGFVGLTVNYWNGVWLYAALCLGIRASLKEYCWTGASARAIAGEAKLRFKKFSRDYGFSQSSPVLPIHTY